MPIPTLWLLWQLAGMPQARPAYSNPYVPAYCVNAAAVSYRLPPGIIWSVLATEGGIPGTMHRNSNGSYDLGPMQINTVWLSYFQRRFGIAPAQILYNSGCVNIMSGAYILRLYIDSSPDFWTGVGRYNSSNPRHGIPYMRRVFGNAVREVARPWTLDAPLFHEVVSSESRERFWSLRQNLGGGEVGWGRLLARQDYVYNSALTPPPLVYQPGYLPSRRLPGITGMRAGRQPREKNVAGARLSENSRKLADFTYRVK